MISQRDCQLINPDAFLWEKVHQMLMGDGLLSPDDDHRARGILSSLSCSARLSCIHGTEAVIFSMEIKLWTEITH